MERCGTVESSKSHILIVDDDPINTDILIGILGQAYDLTVTANGKDALEQATSEPCPDLILLDVMMPEMDGHEVCKRLKANAPTDRIPVIFVTAMDNVRDEEEGFLLGAAEYITKPFTPSIVALRVRNQIELFKARKALEDQNTALKGLVSERTEEIQQTQEATILTLGAMAKIRDNDTDNHVQRTRTYIALIAAALSETPRYRDILDEDTIDLICKSAPLHDVGKIGISDQVLRKPGKFTDAEFEEMKTHTVLGFNALNSVASILGSNSFLEVAKSMALCHHEKWNGTGYPLGLSGDAIPLSARLMAVADVYDALISERVYKSAYSHETALEIIQEGSGSHFDPDVVEAFMKVNKDIDFSAKQATPASCPEQPTILDQHLNAEPLENKRIRPLSH